MKLIKDKKGLLLIFKPTQFKFIKMHVIENKMNNLLLTFIILIFCTCNQSMEKEELLIRNFDTADTLIKDIPKGGNEKFISYYYLKNDVEKKAGIESIENGYDSLEFRFYYGYTLSHLIQGIILKRSSLGWSGQLIYLTSNYSESNDSLVSISRKTKNVMPKCGWNSFIRQLLALGVLTLRDDTEIQDYESCNDGDGLLIEIATRNKYRIYRYQCFRGQPSVVSQFENIIF